MNGKPLFTESDVSTFLSLIETPDLSSVELGDKKYADYARYLLKKFHVKLKKENLEKFGRFVARCFKANKKNIGRLEEAAAIIFKRKLRLEAVQNRMEHGVDRVKHLVEENRLAKEVSFDRLSPDAQRWKGHIKLLGMKSFKVAWYDKVKEPSDIVYTDNDEYSSRIKTYFNKPIFQIPETTMEGMRRHTGGIKHDFEEFPPGFYEYIEYMFYLIEAQLANKANANGQPQDRTIFMLTSAPSKDKIDPDTNIIAVDTRGHDRPTYKGLPEFANPDDVQKARETAQEFPQKRPQAAVGIGYET